MPLNHLKPLCLPRLRPCANHRIRQKMLRNIILALALLAGSAVAEDTTCPIEITVFTPINQVCATGNSACMTEIGEMYDMFGGCEAEDGTITPCGPLVSQYCSYMCMASMSSISALQTDGKTFKDVPITFLKEGDMVESRDQRNKKIASKVRE